MFYELIDQKKNKDKARDSKTKPNTKNILGYYNFESSYKKTKNSEILLATFIPPWLRNSLGLNQKKLLSHATASSDQKPAKIISRSKEASQNDFDGLKQSVEQNSCKEWKNHIELEANQCNQIDKTGDNVKNNFIETPGYRQLKSKESETELNYTSTDLKLLGKGDWKKLGCDVLISSETGNLKEEDIRKIKLIRQKNKLKKRMSSDQKPSTIGKSDIDFLLQMKAREVVENFKKKDVHSLSPEIRNLETKLLLLGAKPPSTNYYKLKQQDLRFLQEMKNQIVSLEDFEKFLQHLKQINFRDIVKISDFYPNDDATEKKREEKEEKKEKKSGRDIPQKKEYDDRYTDDHDFLESTDDEDNVKRFSQFLSKNDNIEEKKKCLEEVRNYFEKKRKFRLSKRRCVENESKKNCKPDKKDDANKEKLKPKNIFKGMKSKFGIYDEDVINKALEETIQKFTELYHINLTPAVMETMKKSIFQYMTSNIPKSNRFPPVYRKINLDQFGLEGKEPEKIGYVTYPDELPSPTTDSVIFKELKKKNFKSFINRREEPIDVTENEKFKHLRKEFDNFLNSVQFNIDFTDLKLQSVILEKEESAPSRNVQFVYNFTKKSLEQEKTEAKQRQNNKENYTQTHIESELSKRNVKVQAFECKSTFDQNWQTEDPIVKAESTQTCDELLGVKYLEELKLCDVSPGLYRMVKSKEAGKFYLYPEQLDQRKRNSHLSFVTNKKLHRKKDFFCVSSKGSTRDKKFHGKNKEKVKSKKSKRVKNCALEEKKIEEIEKRENHSLNCLYFRNLGQSHSGMLSARKDAGLTDTNTKTDESRDMGLGDIVPTPEKDHLKCFWFWNGEKIAPGCDLKTHVESFLKEKLKEFINFEYAKNKLGKPVLKKIKKVTKKTPTLPFSDFDNAESVISGGPAEDENEPEEYKTDENDEVKEVGNTTPPACEEKFVRSVATQNSDSVCNSVNLSKLKISSSKIFTKGNLVIKHHYGKAVSTRKAEHIVEAIEQLKKIKQEAKTSKNDISRDSESLLNFSVSTKELRADTNDPLPTAFGRQDNVTGDKMSPDVNFEEKLKKLVSLVNCEIQRNEDFEGEDRNLAQNSQNENHKEIELIETVLNRITHKERENLWNDVRKFIKNRISRDINDDDEREVCIEIEQDLRKNDRGELNEILAKGHFRRNEGDIEVEIDLTLDDLERILQQRQKKIRRRSLYRTNVSKFLSNSSIQSDLTKEELLKYQKYFHNLTIGGGRVQDENMKDFL